MMRNDQNRRLDLAAVAAACAALLASGCANDPVLRSEPAREDGMGFVYALPRAAVQIEAERVDITPKLMEEAVKALAQAQATHAAAKKQGAAAKAALDQAKGIEKFAKGEGAAKAKERLELALALQLLRASQLLQAVQDEAKAEQRVKALSGGAGEMEQTVTLTVLPPVPDPKHRYQVRDLGSLTRDESVKLTVNNGLLNTVDSTTTGQVGTILVNLASSLASVHVTYKPSQSLKADTAAKAKQDCKPFRYIATFDPTDPTDIGRINKAVNVLAGGSYLLTRHPEEFAEPPPASASSPPPPPPPPPKATDGLRYRAPLTVDLSVIFNTPACTQKVNVSGAFVSAVVPDSSASYVLPIDASGFTKVNTELAFKDGMPVTLGYDKPSRLAAVSRIPIDILKAILEVPGSILKLRVDYSSQEAALIKSRSAEDDARLALLKAQQALKDEQERIAKLSLTPP
jgi:hypothetical protein